MANSPQQQAVIDFVKTGTGSAIVTAVAGSGKTTTIINASEFAKGSVAMVAYGKKNALDFQGKLSNRGLNHVKSGTAHSFGCGSWRKAFPNCKIDPSHDGKEKWSKLMELSPIPHEYRTFVKSLISLAKQKAIGFSSSIDVVEPWNDIIDHFDLAYELAEGDNLSIDEGVELSQKTLVISNELSKQLINFDDMPYMPLVGNTRMWPQDVIFVDEAQDTNPARRALYKKMLRPGGRAIFVGDPHQAIFGFTGADNDSLDIIQREFSCKQLPLTVTFRCPKKVVELARTWVDHITAYEGNIDGEVNSTNVNDLLKSSETLQPTSAVLCRNTKPLVELAFKFIRKGVACRVEGRAIGAGLVALIRRWKVTSLQVLRDRLEIFLETETQKLMAKGREESAANLADKIETIFVMMESMPPGSKVADLQTKIFNFFEELTEGNQKKNILTLMTAHRSKGLEFPTVYLLGRNKYMPSPFARQDWQVKQETNLQYVAVTRTQERLTDIVV